MTSALLGGAAGVMLAATSFSLIVPGIEHGNLLWPGYGVYAVAIGILLGAFCLDLVDRLLPHEHFILGQEGTSSSMKRIRLFIIAITIHNFPEGLAVALPLLGLGYSRSKTIGIATLTGLVGCCRCLHFSPCFASRNNLCCWSHAFCHQ